MPFHLEKVGDNEYYVVTTDTGKRHSSHPLPYKKAVGQFLALQRVYEDAVRIHKENNKKRYRG